MTRKHLLNGSLLALAGLLLLPSSGAQAAPTATDLHLLKSIPIPGEGGWDYLLADGNSHRLYISRGTHVIVLDTEKEAVVGDIPNTQGVHGIALAPKLNKGFTSNGRDNTVTVFDLKTLKETSRIPVGKNPDCIIYDPFSNRVFTFNGGSNDVTAIDADSDTVTGKVEVGGRPEYAVTDRAGNIFLNVEDKSEILNFDAKTLAVKHHWPVAPAEEPSGLAIDRKHHRLFAVCGNEKMAILDSETGKVVATPTIGKGPDAAAFDPGEQLAYSSNGEGTITVIKEETPDTFTVVGTIPTQPMARTMALDAKAHRIYLVTAKLAKTQPTTGAGEQRYRRSFEPNSFTVLVVGK